MTPIDFPEFIPTAHSTAADKQEFARHFVSFVSNDFNRRLFTKAFYNRLSMCFGHIAHYNQEGFWHTWFESTAKRLDFLRNVLTYTCPGWPSYTYCDVEKFLQVWLKRSGLVEQYQQKLSEETERAERAELARLQAKYNEQKTA